MADSDAEKALMGAVQEMLEEELCFKRSEYLVENEEFDPEGRTKWAAIFFIYNQPDRVTLGQGGYDRQSGFMQIDFNIPQGQGAGDFGAWFDKCRETFVVGRSFTEEGQSVIIESCGQSQGRYVDNWFRKSVTVIFRTEFVRTTFNT